MENGRIRIADIAEELGLSSATVSNVIHGKRPVYFCIDKCTGKRDGEGSFGASNAKTVKRWRMQGEKRIASCNSDRA